MTFERTDWETASEADITLLAAVFRRPEALETSEHICRILESGRHEIVKDQFFESKGGRNHDAIVGTFEQLRAQAC